MTDEHRRCKPVGLLLYMKHYRAKVGELWWNLISMTTRIHAFSAWKEYAETSIFCFDPGLELAHKNKLQFDYPTCVLGWPIYVICLLGIKSVNGLHLRKTKRFLYAWIDCRKFHLLVIGKNWHLPVRDTYGSCKRPPMQAFTKSDFYHVKN